MIENNKILVTLIIIALVFLSCVKRNSQDLQGYVEGELTYMASPFSGQLTNLFVQRGETVAADQILFSLDQQPQLDELTQAEKNLAQAAATLTNLEKGQRSTVVASIQAQLEQAQANLELAGIRVKRYKALYLSKSVEKDKLDETVTHYQAQQALVEEIKANLAEAQLGSREDVIKAQQAAVQQAKTQVDNAKWALGQKSQFATTPAVVFDTFYRPGEFVPPNSPVLALLAQENINIIFFIPATMLSHIKLGDTITIGCDGCTQPYKAKISYISPQAEYTPPVIYSRENNYKLVYRIKAKPGPDDLRFFHPGQPVYVTINLQGTR